MPSFLDDIEADLHEEALLRGNLSRPKAPPITWAHTGYHARIQRIDCHCGVSASLFIGIFSVETSSLGATRETAIPLSRESLLNRTIRQTIFPSSVAVCPYCL